MVPIDGVYYLLDLLRERCLEASGARDANSKSLWVHVPVNLYVVVETLPSGAQHELNYDYFFVGLQANPLRLVVLWVNLESARF